MLTEGQWHLGHGNAIGDSGEEFESVMKNTVFKVREIF